MIKAGVDIFQCQPDGAHLKREADDPRGQCRPGPAENQADIKRFQQPCAKRCAGAKTDQQQIAHHNRWQDEGQMHQGVDQNPAGKACLRQKGSGQNGKGQGTYHRHAGNAQA